jgi:hypothetical protein
MKDAKGHGSDPRGAHAAGINAIGQESTTSRELRLFADNDGNLHRQSFVPVVNNLSKKMDKGVYDPAKAEKLWQYHADRAAQAYTKQFGSGGQKWHQMFGPEVRREAAKHWQSEIGPRIKGGEYK